LITPETDAGSIMQLQIIRNSQDALRLTHGDVSRGRLMQRRRAR
jgi:hypothetical protein